MCQKEWTCVYFIISHISVSIIFRLTSLHCIDAMIILFQGSRSRTKSLTVAASSKLNVDDILEKLRTEIENS